MPLATFLRDLRTEYLALHTRKEDLFWQAKMGLADDTGRAQEELGRAEIAVNRFLQSPDRLKRLRALEAANHGSPEDRHVLGGWIAMFGAHVIEDPAGQKLSEEIVEREQALEHARGTMRLGYTDPDSGVFHPASSNKLALMMRVEHDERRRRAAFEGLRSIEQFVLEHGFLDIVAMRNRLGRLLGYEDYYDWKVNIIERMTKRTLFNKLDDLAERTRERSTHELEAFEKKHGAGSREPWNFPYLRSGKLTEALDPYFGFATALRRWVESFEALSVSFRGATLTLDLLDRQGKYENGFMHGPAPAFFADGQWQAARINFTANAVAGQVGSGLRAAETLFHEGGHAAHFSNVLSQAPCFSQEFAPTSVAYAETQSMFLDSLLGDADWRVRYASDRDGRPMPMGLVEESVRDTQPLRGWEVRSMLTVPFAERAIYEMDEATRTPEHVVAELRRIESQQQGLTAGVRPVLAVPHLLSGESSAYYHGYVLAEMAVFQTRAFFLERDGALTDNSRIGPDLATHYWAPGNAVTFDHTVQSLTGRSLSADSLAHACNRTVDHAIADARASVARAHAHPRAAKAAHLDATIHVVHGRERIASTDDGGIDGLCAAFETWVEQVEAAARPKP
ncbi:MAG: M3 family metallopeptidase [Vicinamibacterales bacterium]